MNKEHIKSILRKVPTHIALILICAIWLVPTLGLLVTSFRPLPAINTTGWWTAFNRPGAKDYSSYCAECHGGDGKLIAAANLTNPDLISKFSRSANLLLALEKEINGEPHMGTIQMPGAQDAANILNYMRNISGVSKIPLFTLNNYIDALMGYRGTKTYVDDCAAGSQSVDLKCEVSDLLNPRGMGRAFLNSLAVSIPSTLLPILFAAFAAYAFSWMEFRGRQVLFGILVGLQIIPLQMTFIPISRLYAQLDLNGTFLGTWLFHTGFGLPYAIFLIRNFLGGLPREVFESAYLDGASHWTAFTRLAIPLSVPALASLGIYQFLWIWNDFLVALVFLGGQNPVMTYQIANMVTSLGSGWELLTAAAFLSMALPMVVFFSLQRYFTRGMLAGSVKG